MPARYEDWVADRESVTQLYVRPAPSRFTPTPVPPAITATHPVRLPPQPHNLVGLGFLVVCVLVGIIIGTVLSLRGGGRAVAAPTPAPAPVPHMVVMPIEPEPAAPAAVVAPAKADPDTKIIELVEDDTPAPPAAPEHHTRSR